MSRDMSRGGHGGRGGTGGDACDGGHQSRAKSAALGGFCAVSCYAHSTVFAPCGGGGGGGGGGAGAGPC
ncbi:hypothetical protein JYU34_008375 [Plutella xylostella]|uniref:Uncharacterized protein n=1 Tax=Plutella xylostella TaxID=51655 RepID=A0ABQ7QKT2_PLUXY|nr:hypothetical protein JYU34_008375 [Plutella xylostella]